MNIKRSPVERKFVLSYNKLNDIKKVTDGVISA